MLRGVSAPLGLTSQAQSYYELISREIQVSWFHDRTLTSEDCVRTGKKWKIYDIEFLFVLAVSVFPEEMTCGLMSSFTEVVPYRTSAGTSHAKSIFLIMLPWWLAYLRDTGSRHSKNPLVCDSPFYCLIIDQSSARLDLSTALT